MPDTVSTAFSTLLQKVEGSHIAALPSVGFVSKQVGNAKYWYCQYTDISGARKQKFFAPDSIEARQRIESIKITAAEAGQIIAERRRLVAMLISGGATAEKGRSARVISKLAEAGVFSLGGVLIGSYAFSCYGNMLGVSFENNLRRTEDMDIAYDRSIAIGFDRDIRADIASADTGMVEPAQINPWVPPYEMVAPDGFKIEFLTTKSDALDKAPVSIERFGIHAHPLDFMDYLIKAPVSTVVLYDAGILVKVPDPARFAIHKIALSRLRHPAHLEKIRKDLAQAEAVIEVLLEDNPGALILAAEATLSREDNLFSFFKTGSAALRDPIADRFSIILEGIL